MRKAAIALFVLVAVCWTGGWFVAAHLAGQRMDALIKAEAARGRVWTCPNRTIGGFPVALTIACNDATFAGRGLGQVVEASVAHVLAEASITHPTSIAINLQPPFAYKTSDHAADVSAKWTDLRIDLAGLPDIEKVAVHAEDIDVHGVFAGAGEQGGRAKGLDGAFTTATGTTGEPAVVFDVAATQADMPPMDAFLGGKVPVDLQSSGRLKRTDITDASTPEEVIDQWRVAGGTIDLDQLLIVRGESRVTAKGQLRLDDSHRLQGRLDSKFVGLEPILKRFGINVNIASAGAFLSTLLGGRKDDAPLEPGAITLPINLQNGRVVIGPVVTQIQLLPLY